ncbi:mannonate dehydratase [Rhizobium ruizarguesonis]|uniref:mannonate dehydratase n=1 Tax=Rhizobium ruizarguesonis TaxID=2081791 RepID=UPI00102F4D29|nr:mannonate dehydratase [Rhizobium ruizarguesonis]NKJ75295.1 mannonate dehydratase [Rhizobium leguminosarum bv. viciae]NEH80753.1 mannonate dehydratase [Rhizobium ruizarguesonis]NEI80854.1 mannonate dehydratase [Rhizobium ruizarguesonis]NKQ75026.1 mannonate dehydratase [Rhizobium ruizarguesonis]NKQ82075.1 mannonate dehydratase [Rhizobium ruizarguesonis]
MYLGTQVAARDDDDYRIFAQLGVKHINADPPGKPSSWTLSDLERHRDKVESFGLILDMIQLPLPSQPIEKASYPDILLAGPERDRQIDAVCKLIENVAAAGIPSVKYNLNLIGIPRTPDEPGRGGSLNASFRWDKTDQQAEPGLAGVLSEDENWERIDYFLERVVPVAASNRVRLACHPHDPYTPPGYRGVTRVLGTVEGLKKFVLMRENAYHGLNFCQGSIGEMLENPGKEIDDVIRWFGQRGKIFNVHFRNIRGGKLSFMETFPEEGDMDMVRSARIYKEVGFKYMLMPDHVPTVSGKDPSATAFAFCYGYIAALLQVLESE